MNIWPIVFDVITSLIPLCTLFVILIPQIFLRYFKVCVVDVVVFIALDHNLGCTSRPPLCTLCDMMAVFG